MTQTIKGVATLTSPASSASSATLLAANGDRRGVIIQNSDANPLYVKYGATATADDYTVKIPGNDGYWEMPEPIWPGVIDGIWAADGSGSAYITEIT